MKLHIPVLSPLLAALSSAGQRIPASVVSLCTSVLIHAVVLAGGWHILVHGPWHRHISMPAQPLEMADIRWADAPPAPVAAAEPAVVPPPPAPAPVSQTVTPRKPRLERTAQTLAHKPPTVYRAEKPEPQEEPAPPAPPAPAAPAPQVAEAASAPAATSVAGGRASSTVGLGDTPEAPPQQYVSARVGAGPGHGHNPRPPYPRGLQMRGIEGTVHLRVRVEASGNASDVLLKRSSGHAAFDDSALRTVRSWRFQPARLGAQTVASWVEFPIRFRLDD